MLMLFIIYLYKAEIYFCLNEKSKSLLFNAIQIFLSPFIEVLILSGCLFQHAVLSFFRYGENYTSLRIPLNFDRTFFLVFLLKIFNLMRYNVTVLPLCYCYFSVQSY